VLAGACTVSAEAPATTARVICVADVAFAIRAVDVENAIFAASDFAVATTPRAQGVVPVNH
jgi:hypothetical protein